jgi:2'-5' RNA ligase
MDKKLYLLAELDDDTQKEFINIEKVILENGINGSQTKNIPYHITLCSYSVDNENKLIELLDNVVNDFKEIEISYSSLGLFGLKVLFANPDMNSELIKLYNYVKENGSAKDEHLAAHTTLLIDEPENILKVLPEVTKAFNAIHGKIKYISLYEFFPARFIKRIEIKRPL